MKPMSGVTPICRKAVSKVSIFDGLFRSSSWEIFDGVHFIWAARSRLRTLFASMWCASANFAAM
ncbi:hypothetical protein D3C87_2095850 [compost metagenome]